MLYQGEVGEGEVEPAIPRSPRPFTYLGFSSFGTREDRHEAAPCAVGSQDEIAVAVGMNAATVASYNQDTSQREELRTVFDTVVGQAYHYSTREFRGTR